MDRPTNFAELVSGVIDIIALIVPVIFALAFIVIAWKIISAWIIYGGQPEKIEEGKKVAIVGVIVLVIMSGIWGILELLQQSLFG